MKTILRTWAGRLMPLLVAGSVLAETNDAPKILFLHVRIEKEKTVKLIDSQVREGELKPPLKASELEGVHYDLWSKNGESLWHGVVADASRHVIEYEDPPRSGKLKKKHVELPAAEFTVRVPALTNAQRVEFYAVEVSTNGVAQTNQLGFVNMSTK